MADKAKSGNKRTDPWAGREWFEKRRVDVPSVNRVVKRKTPLLDKLMPKSSGQKQPGSTDTD